MFWNVKYLSGGNGHVPFTQSFRETSTTKAFNHMMCTGGGGTISWDFLVSLPEK